MYEYLRQHPQIFMPAFKEPHYFGDDLSHPHGRLSERDYLSLFRAAKPGQRVGEASTWYLASASAARAIAQFNPRAQIIVMLRDPVDVMYSLHRNLVFYGEETIVDFEAALAAEEDRRTGRRAEARRRREWLLYREAVKYGDQLERYQELFGSQIHLIFYEDFVRDVAATYTSALDFLRVDSSFAPDFPVVNESKQPRHTALQDFVVRPPAPLARIIPLVRRVPVAHRIRAYVLNANSKVSRPAGLSPALRLRLAEEMRPQIEKLERLAHRDLTDWKGSSAASLERHSSSTAAAPQ